MTGAQRRRLEGAELGERVSGSGSGSAGRGRQGSPRRRDVTLRVWVCGEVEVPEPGKARSLREARVNRKKGDKGFESPRPYKL